MNELLQKHGCSNVFTIPDGLRELMADISREVLRDQPINVCDYIANYLSALLITREHGIMAVKILDDLCDCRPSVSEHLIRIGMSLSETKVLSEIINEEIKSVQMIEGKEKVKEAEILKRILKRYRLDEDMTAQVCQIARNAYRDYWYRKKILEQNIKVQPDEPWETAAQHTLEIYKRTQPSFSELTRATQKIQAAYRGYHVRKQMLNQLKPKKPQAPKVDLLGPPVDIAESRDIDLGLVLDINNQVRVDDMSSRFVEDDHMKFGIGYDTMKTLTHEPSQEEILFDPYARASVVSKKSMGTVDGRRKSFMSETGSRKSVLMDTTLRSRVPEPVMNPVAEVERSDEELPYPPIDTLPPESHITFGNVEQVEQIPDFAIPATEETTYDSEHATPTYDIELSSASKTMSVPTSGTTTAPTSDIEDIAMSGTDEEGEE
ncbi:hypothetical protein O0L34_g15298 [Tuta absoluta]|nr:hypothetical protein O0L34_g15298 [Tuta absoluta]